MQRLSLLLSLVIVGCSTLNVQPPINDAVSTLDSSGNNELLVSFGVGAGDGVDEITSCLEAYHTYRFALYQDGYLILFDGDRYLETVLSQAEVNKLLTEIDEAGLFSVSGNGDQYAPPAPTPAYAGGLSYFISVKGKTVEVHHTHYENVVPSIDKTKKIIENFHPSSLKIHRPESVKIWTVLTRDISLGIASPTPEAPLLNWSSDTISLEPLTREFHVLTGSQASFVLDQVKTIPAFHMVQQNEQDYLVLVCPNF